MTKNTRKALLIGLMMIASFLVLIAIISHSKELAEHDSEATAYPSRAPAPAS